MGPGWQMLPQLHGQSEAAVSLPSVNTTTKFFKCFNSHFPRKAPKYSFTNKSRAFQMLRTNICKQSDLGTQTDIDRVKIVQFQPVFQLNKN